MGKRELAYQHKSKKSAAEGNKFLFHYLPRDERYEIGKQIRKDCPRSSHAILKAPENRTEVVDLIMESNKGRSQKLLPLRHGRMARSPFTFYRGSALNMTADLSGTPVTGINVQHWLSPMPDQEMQQCSADIRGTVMHLILLLKNSRLPMPIRMKRIIHHL